MTRSRGNEPALDALPVAARRGARDKLLQVRLSAHERELLREVAAAQHRPASEVIRDMVRTAARRIRASARPRRAESRGAAP
jgi:hypothetical protein